MLAALKLEELHVQVRMLAGIQIKNYLKSRNAMEADIKLHIWLNISEEIRNNFKNQLILALDTAHREVQHSASMAIATIADMDVPRGEWPDLFNILVRYVSQIRFLFTSFNLNN